MIYDVINAASQMNVWEFMLVSACSVLLVSGICGVLGMGDDF